MGSGVLTVRGDVPSAVSTPGVGQGKEADPVEISTLDSQSSKLSDSSKSISQDRFDVSNIDKIPAIILGECEGDDAVCSPQRIKRTFHTGPKYIARRPYRYNHLKYGGDFPGLVGPYGGLGGLPHGPYGGLGLPHGPYGVPHGLYGGVGLPHGPYAQGFPYGPYGGLGSLPHGHYGEPYGPYGVPHGPYEGHGDLSHPPYGVPQGPYGVPHGPFGGHGLPHGPYGDLGLPLGPYGPPLGPYGVPHDPHGGYGHSHGHHH